MENKYLEALKTFKDEMIEYIEDNYEGEKGMGADEASYFLGYDVSNWSQDEINEAVEEVQIAYYTEGDPDFDKIVETYLELQ